MLPETILLVDDDEKMKTIVADVLRHEGFSMLTAMNGQDAVSAFRENTVDIVLLDLGLPDVDGIELLRQFLVLKPHVPVIIISGFATIDRAVQATKLGAFDFMEKPLDPKRVLVTLKNALERGRLERGQQVLVEDMMERYGIVGVSEEMRRICISVSRIAKLDIPVLLTGENGTGKEIVAHMIHNFSGLPTLVCINCAAIPQELIESELFGHHKGSFTGAVTDHPGKFEAADGGTLFLDEIGDMSHGTQAKILRALEGKEITRIGGTTATKVNVRVIAATNKNLAEEIRQNRFREDLYYRLRGVTLHIPPLRERRDDIPPLAEHFLQDFCRERSLPTRRFTKDALDTIREQEWRGNVRELKHVVGNLAIFADDDVIDHLAVRTLLQSLSEGGVPVMAEHSGSSLHQSTISFERTLIQKTLHETDGNITRAAERLRIDRATLSKKIKRLGLKAGHSE
jgi:DNA-binding NtrC family response regulator